MKTSKVISKYLANYAENISPWLVDFPQNQQFKQCVVIPVFDESPAFANRLQALAPDNTLIILVLNCTNESSLSQRKTTQYLKTHLTSQSSVIWHSPSGNTLQLMHTASTTKGKSEKLYWLIWDITPWDSSKNNTGNAATQTTSFVHGVGYARKLGMDTALQLFYQQQITDPLFLSTDADAILPENYFDCSLLANSTLSLKPNQVAGYIFPFQHKTLSAKTTGQTKEKTTSTTTAALLYEISLRYYVLGLRWAKSPWGFHTVGSTLAIHAYHYAANRGFPKREAGEDFYLLNKIAKTGAVLSLREPAIILSDRASHRVPFGTGPAVRRIQDLHCIDTDFVLYHPTIFLWLAEWLSLIPELYTYSLKDVVTNKKIIEILQRINIEKAITHSQKQSKSPQEFKRHMLTWFDAFKTLKFIHGARDRYLTSLPVNEWFEWIATAKTPFLTLPPEILAKNNLPDKIQCFSTHIEKLEKQTLPFISTTNP